ncbi:hypothetical protein PHYPSEUDO_008279 [Phytophthora pseudosyringae]|uniref:Uncharacterized protein n=1 Tax=Phytophthora pseudosyringae TaxID=221518 RepID=A0A8T1VHN3_9STRA|nr:hypothetical protein PHYPSEUDO_008279 [Phytophthora pseudosyringae]
MLSSGSSDDQRDAESPAEDASDSADAELALRSFGSGFTSAALDYLSQVEELSLEMEQLRSLERIVDRATGRLRCCSEGRNAEELQPDGGSRLVDVLVAAFQLTASQLHRVEKRSPDAHRLLRGCNLVIDALWAVGAEGDGSMNERRPLWRELLCRRWDHVAASLALEMLLLRAPLGHINSEAALMRTDAILQVVAFAYPQFPVLLKEFCLEQVTVLARTLVTEGPACLCTPRMLLQLELLERLAAVHFLGNSDDLDATRWLNEDFPECFESCGVVLQLLNEQSDDEHAEDGVGLVRMLDMCLLVFKTVVDFYLETRRNDISTLLKILTPTVLAALSQLATRLAVFGEASAAEGISEARCLETSLYLLARMAVVSEEDDCDALRKIFEKLLAPSAASGFSSARPRLLSACFDAVYQILVHSNVAEIMGPPLTALLQVGDLSVLHAQYLSRKVCPTGNSEAARHCACSRFTQQQLCGEDGAFTENSASVASLLFGMDLDDTNDPVKRVVQGPAHVLDAPDWDQPCASVLKADAPQWFDDEDSDAELEVEPLLLADADERDSSQVIYTTLATSVPQWFEGDDEEGEPDVDLPQCALESSSDGPELSPLPVPTEDNVCAFDQVVDADVASDDGSDCSRRSTTCSSERSRPPSLASLPN